MTATTTSALGTHPRHTATGSRGRFTGRSEDPVGQLVEDNLALVNQVVFGIGAQLPRHVRSEDLVDAGALGLVEAAKRYDRNRGVPFRSYAVRRIRGAVMDAVRHNDWAPRSVRASARRIEAAEQAIAGDLGRVPSSRETAAAAGMSTREMDRVRAAVDKAAVLAVEQSASDFGGNNRALSEVLADTAPGPLAELEERELCSYLRDALACLPKRQRLVVLGYFIEGRTSEELADRLGVTESRISQIRTEALANLRRGLTSQFNPDSPRGPEPTDDNSTVDLRDNDSHSRGRAEPIAQRRQQDYALRIAGASGFLDRLECAAATTESGFVREISRLADRLESVP